MFKKGKKNESAATSPKKDQDAGSNNCPRKDGDNCLEPGVFNDSDPIGGGG